ncbi:MAG: hypothetical protein CFE43_17025 [Burkholderiales bacterium PBB3]|nr:MAG: hypothetical protein CFE43_17025 [Burkholderiales bacterium PBB3]
MFTPIPAKLRRYGPLPEFALLAALAFSPKAFAQTPEAPALWEVGALGVGLRQQAYPGSSQEIGRAFVLPYFIYRGQYWRADEGNIGLRAVKTDSLELDVGFAGAFGSNSNEVDARNGMPDLGTLFEFGPKLKWYLGDVTRKDGWRAELALRGVFDLSDKLRDKGVSLEPELIYVGRPQSGWRYGASMGLVFGDQRLTDTFYGVAPVYATATRPAYSAQPGLIMTRLSLNLSRAITPDISVFGFARWATLEGAANGSSPLVRQNHATALGVGLAYTLAKSTERAAR